MESKRVYSADVFMIYPMDEDPHLIKSNIFYAHFGYEKEIYRPENVCLNQSNAMHAVALLNGYER